VAGILQRCTQGETIHAELRGPRPERVPPAVELKRLELGPLNWFGCLGRKACLIGVPHQRTQREHGCGAAMGSGGVLVHRSGCLGAATAVLAAEFLGGDGVFTEGALERGKTVHRLDGVMSHSFIVVAYPWMTPN
jgi:hypothetical protein